MFRFYTPVFLLQCFCLYHAYTYKAESKWYWLILFFPFIGSLIYLYVHFYNQRNIESVKDGVLNIVNSDYKEEQLKRETRFADTIANKEKLADEFLNKGKYSEAIELYHSCLEGVNSDDISILTKLVRANYLDRNYADAIQFGEQLGDHVSFRNTEERIAMAWSYYELGEQEKSEAIFTSMDARFSNYPHRLAYSRFLNQSGRTSEALQKLEELIEEIDHMDRYEKRLKRNVYREIKRLHAEIQDNG